ncbi:protein KRI1 protein [Dioscorea alata]|uniref:Protein KRI1 protein n=1 Tax=Dioscorea alata TaxID=55571 RepID=A0ACB7VSX8_DIOAL|nr:protein KRI1 protein [Dioscorea alata]
MAIDLFDGAGSADEEVPKLEIDHEFARRFEHNKRRADLHRLEELKARGVAKSSSSSSDDDEDSDESEDDEELAGNSGKDLKFYDALVRIKKQDPFLHEKDAKLFSSDDEEFGENPKPLKKEKREGPQYLKDVMAKHLIEHGPEFDDDDAITLKKNPKIYKKEQMDDIKAFLEAEKEALGSDDDVEFFKEKEKEEGDAEDEDAGQIQMRLDEYFGDDEKLDENEMFLKNFFKEKMWVDKEKDKKPVFDDIGVSEDEGELEKQDKYEAEYNFRHEEAEGDDRVWGHARVTEGSVRKKSSSRKVQRKSKEERMALAEYERKEELKHLKNLKKKEIQEKLEKIRAIAGIEDGDCKINADDLEEDFDPEEYDRKMREVFDTRYYDAEDADPGFGSDAEGDLEKPDFDKEDELLGLGKDWDVLNSNEGFAAARERMLKKKEEEDNDEEEEDVERRIGREGKRKRKRKISLKEKVELEKELEEYYKLDYEDTIGDLKTRFKYTSVPAKSYGLSASEILMTDDKNLNQFVSLKKLAPYRQKEWKVTYHHKLKKDLILHGKKPEGKKSDKKHGLIENSDSKVPEKKDEMATENGEAIISRRAKRRHRQAELKLSQSRLAAYGKIPVKTHKKQ